MPSVKLALSHVNEHPSILTNYRLHMWWNDTEVSKTTQHILQNSAKLSLFDEFSAMPLLALSPSST